MLLIISKIEGEKYRLLLDFLLKECDALSFQISDLSINDIYFMNPDQMSEEDALKEVEKINMDAPRKSPDEVLNLPDSIEYLTYKASLENYLQPFRKFVFKDYEDVEYLTYEYGIKMEIFFAHLDESLLPELKKVNGLYDWLYPNMPEDLSFFKNGYCFLRSVAHEKLCFIHSNDKTVKKFLRGIGLYYYIDNINKLENVKFY